MSNELEGIRIGIDTVDDSILELLQERQKLVMQAAVTKQKLGLATHQPERFAVIISRLHARAVELGLDLALVDLIWEAIHQNSLSLQESIPPQPKQQQH